MGLTSRLKRVGGIFSCSGVIGKGVTENSSVTFFDALTAQTPARFTAFSLPTYRFVPDVQPHPAADPRGHSYVRAPRFPATAVDGHRWRDSPSHLYGCDLYNCGFWWEAREAWEMIWHLAARGSPERAALQGLIELANCHLKLYVSRLNAVARLTRSYGGHFDQAAGLVGAPFLGLDLQALRRRADDYFRDVTAGDEARHDPPVILTWTLQRAGPARLTVCRVENPSYMHRSDSGASGWRCAKKTKKASRSFHHYATSCRRGSRSADA